MDDESNAKLHNEIEAKSTDNVYLSTKREIVNYYKAEYPGRGPDSWKRHLVRDMARLTGMKEKSLEKRFDPQRLNNEEKRNAKQYADLGRTLPPTKKDKDLRGKRAVVTIDTTIWISNKPYTRFFTRTLSEKRTQYLLEQGGVNAIFEEYGINPDSIEDMEINSISIDFI
jgi:hypothetical protein